MHDVSIDIEACGEVLLSIGACTFDPHSGEIKQSYYTTLPVQEQLDLGLKMDGRTFLWWLQQSDAARKALSTVSPQPNLQDTLDNFSAWMNHPYLEPRVWAYPASYDLPVIARVYRAAKMRVPWKWTKTMCARTLWNLACEINPELLKIEKIEDPDQHHALADAIRQAGWITKYLVGGIHASQVSSG